MILGATTTSLKKSLAGRSVFLTGHTGFKGSWLSIWLHRLGAHVSGYSLAAPTTPNNFEASAVRQLLTHHYEADIRDCRALEQAIDESAPDVILHLAAQAIVRESYTTPRETMETNFMGTCNVLECVRRRARPCAVVVITSDKCYENRERFWGYREDEAMGGHDPYSASKGAAEILTASYRRSFFQPELCAKHGVKLATVRAGNVIGGGDWARDRIVPDIVRALVAHEVVSVRNPRAVRPLAACARTAFRLSHRSSQHDRVGRSENLRRLEFRTESGIHGRRTRFGRDLLQCLGRRTLARHRRSFTVA